jgi:hypothetical protein
VDKVLADRTQKPDFLRVFLNILKQIGVFIYEFIFIWEDDEPYEKEGFIDSEKLKHAAVIGHGSVSPADAVENNATVTVYNRQVDVASKDYERLTTLFGEATAEYITNLRNEIDNMVEEHGLVRKNTIMVVIPPEKMQSSLLGREFFEYTLDRIYAQLNNVVLKPGNIRIKHTSSGALFAEMQVEAYGAGEEAFAQV